MTETLLARIERHEGFTPIPKIDVPPNYVIGIGHDITPDQAASEYADGITYGDAINLLEADIARCTDEADTRISCYESLSPMRQDVLVEMIFQEGINGVLKFHNMLAALESGDYAAASKEMLNSLWDKQTPERCRELAGLMLNNG